MKKLKDLLKESYVWERKFGEKLPTLASVVQKKKLKEEINKLTEKLSKSFFSLSCFFSFNISFNLIIITDSPHNLLELPT